MSDLAAEEKPAVPHGATQNPYDVPFPDRPEDLHALFVIWVDKQEGELSVTSGLFPSDVRLGMDATMRVFQSAGQDPQEGEYIFRMSRLDGVQVLTVPEGVSGSEQQELRQAVARVVHPGLDELKRLIRTLPKGEELSEVAMDMASAHFTQKVQEAARNKGRISLCSGYKVRAIAVPEIGLPITQQGIAWGLYEEDGTVIIRIMLPYLGDSPYRDFLQFALAAQLEAVLQNLSSQDILYETLARYEADIREAQAVHTVLRRSTGIQWDRVHQRAIELLREKGILPLEPEEEQDLQDSHMDAPQDGEE